MALTAKQSKFVNEYLKDLNASQAAIRAGYSKNGTRSIANKLMTRADIKAEIALKMGKRSARTEVSADRVLLELSRLAFLDIRKAYGKDGALKAITDMDDDTVAAIAGFDVVESVSSGEVTGVLKKIKLSDKSRALELIMRHLGMLTPAVQTDLDSEIKKIDLERKRFELEKLKSVGGSTMESILRELIGKLPG